MNYQTTDYYEESLDGQQSLERVLLSCIVYYPHAFEDAISLNVNESDFSDKRNLAFWKGLQWIRDKTKLEESQSVDPLLLEERIIINNDHKCFKDRQELTEYLLQILAEVKSLNVSAYSTKEYAGLLKCRTALRGLSKAADTVSLEKFGHSLSMSSLDKIQKELDEVRKFVGPRSSRRAKDVCKDLLEQLISEAETKAPPLKLGFKKLDEILNGVNPGCLGVIAARPGMGKTALALRILLNAAENKTQAIIFSQEMSIQELAERITAMTTGIPLNLVKTCKTNGRREVLQKYISTVAALGESSLHFDKECRVNVNYVRSVCVGTNSDNKARDLPPLGLVVIDYIQMMSSVLSDKATLAEKIGDTTGKLKLLAKDLGCPVLILAQLNREVDKLEDKRPVTSHLKDSGSIEQDADFVLLLHKDQKDPTTVEVIVGKNRHGETGTVKLKWDGAHTDFKDIN